MFDYQKVPVKVANRSGFDKNHFNLYSSHVGTIVPILVDELIPNSTVHLRSAITAAMPPLASDTFMRCRLKVAAFFVPHRIIMHGFEKWITRNDDFLVNSTSRKINPLSISFDFNTDNTGLIDKLSGFLVPGSLADMLGCKLTREAVQGLVAQKGAFRLNTLPFLAYHRIYEDWFRRSLVQRSIFSEDLVSPVLFSASTSDRLIPSNLFPLDASLSTINQNFSPIFADGVHICEYRQANFDFDLLTNAFPEAQNGNAQSVGISSNQFTISALRAANSIQQYLERQNIAGNRYVDYVRANYGAHLSDSIAQRSVLLGSGQLDVYSKGIYQTQTGDTVPSGVNNPFAGVGVEFGTAKADGTLHLVDKFTAQEHGYLMVLAWLSPRASYSTGVSPILSRYRNSQSQAEVANSILQNTGNEPIYQSMVNDMKAIVDSKDVFGYSDRYFAWKDMQDEVHGLFRDGESLQSFALQRTFSDIQSTGIGDEFLQIPTTFLDQVEAVSDNIADFGYWADCFFDYKVSMPLAKYSIPSLQDPAIEHGQTELMSRGGTSIS